MKREKRHAEVRICPLLLLLAPGPPCAAGSRASTRSQCAQSLSQQPAAKSQPELYLRAPCGQNNASRSMCHCYFEIITRVLYLYGICLWCGCGCVLCAVWSGMEQWSSQGARTSANGPKMAGLGHRAGLLQPKCPPSNPGWTQGVGSKISGPTAQVAGEGPLAETWLLHCSFPLSANPKGARGASPVFIIKL
jgi:hypothetical protein